MGNDEIKANTGSFTEIEIMWQGVTSQINKDANGLFNLTEVHKLWSANIAPSIPSEDPDFYLVMPLYITLCG